MFSKSTKLPIKTEYRSRVNAEPLSNGLVLLYEKGLAGKISLYDPQTNTSKPECTLNKDYSFLSDFSEDWFVLIPYKPGSSVLVKSKKTLETLQSITYDKDKKYAVIDRQLVALSFHDTQWTMTFYDANNDFKEAKSINLDCSVIQNDIHESPQKSIKQLANGLVACEIWKVILLFEKQIKDNEVQYLLKRTVEREYDERFVELASGEILTYKMSGEFKFEYKIWNEDHPKSNDFDFPVELEVTHVSPMIDGVHLILDIRHNRMHDTLLYNMKEKKVKGIYVDGKHVDLLHAFPDGSLFFIVNPGSEQTYHLANLKVIHEFKKTVLNAFQKYLLIEQLASLPGWIPKELQNIIFSDLCPFALKEQPSLVRLVNQSSELMDEEKQQNVCSL